MSTPIVTSHRNLHQRIAKLLHARDLMPLADRHGHPLLDELQTDRHPESERTMSQVERPDLRAHRTWRLNRSGFGLP